MLGSECEELRKRSLYHELQRSMEQCLLREIDNSCSGEGQFCAVKIIASKDETVKQGECEA
jgi:hypothetical protein